MEDKIIKMINEAVQPPEGEGFEAVRRRISEQTQQEKEESLRQTAAMLENTQTSVPQNFRRIAAMAASLLVVFGLGIALVAMAVGSAAGNMAESDSAAEEFAADMIMTEESAEEMVDSDENAAVPESDQTADEVVNDDIMLSLTDMPESDAAGEAESVDFVVHTVPQLGLTIELPADAYVSGRDVPKDFELLEIYGISAEQLEANYKDRGIFYNAVWYDDFADVTEIVIKMTEDDISEEIFNLKSASEQQLAEIEKLYHNYEVNINAVVGARYYDVSLLEHEQALFFRAEGVVKNRSGRSNHLQYMTIINGCRIEITLIEHFGINNDLTGEEPEEIAAAHADIMARVVQSAKWERVRSNFFKEHRGIIFYGLVILAGIAAVIFVLLMPENRPKQPNANTALPEETPEENAAGQPDEESSHNLHTDENSAAEHDSGDSADNGQENEEPKNEQETDTQMTDTSE